LAGSGNASVQIMSIKFNDTQLVLLSAASQRDDHCLVPPTGPKRGQAQKAIVKLIEAGVMKEIRAKGGAPIWRRDEEKGHTYALKLTTAGVKMIAVAGTPPCQGEAEQRPDHSMVSVDPKPEPGSAPAAFVDRANGGFASTPKFPRRGTKIAGVVQLLQGSDGMTLAELVANTGWLPHTARAALTGLRKRGYAVVINRADKARGSVYRIESSEIGGDGVAPQTAADVTGGARPDRPGRGASPRSRQAA
jgi:hypothetical protein